jgi:methylthioribose-1-phosphate isomerase
MAEQLNSIAVQFDAKTLNYKVLDQRALPWAEKWASIEKPEDWIELVRGLGIRGAPLIGVTAGLALAQWVERSKPKSSKEIFEMGARLKSTRPTAVNLMRIVDDLLSEAEGSLAGSVYLALAKKYFFEDVKFSEEMSEAGSRLISENSTVMTICNTGSLATVGPGTALGVIRRAFSKGLVKSVVALETRPLLQGARLTTWELKQSQIPHELICDSMAADFMRSRKVSAIFVGADRIAANGDFANKIGTYSLAIAAKYHGVPFYVVAPRTTVDVKSSSGRDIEIEMRDPSEVRGVVIRGEFASFAPEKTPVYNPSFDVTPADLVSGWVIDNRVYAPSEIKEGALLSKPGS